MDEFYRRKLYALLLPEQRQNWECFSDSTQLESWWENNIVKNRLHLSEAIAGSSDRVNLTESLTETPGIWHQIKHPISAENRQINSSTPQFSQSDIDAIAQEKDAEKVFWWVWRFCPEILRQHNNDALLIPAHKILPDCPEHSYRATVSALVGSLFPDNWHQANDSPCLLLFTFSPVQEFIKASRKFLDFWAGSYLLHYLGAKICWAIAEKYGPDAIITPSLWNQEIIDALILQKYPDFASSFNNFTDIKEPKTYLAESTSLRTAGFPNVITALVPGKDVQKLGEELGQKLRAEWQAIAVKVREHIKQCGIEKLQDETISAIAAKFARLDSSKEEDNPYYQELNKLTCQELKKLKQHSNWTWNHLWDAQIENTWETYWTAVPFGHPNKDLQIDLTSGISTEQITDWEQAQNQVAQPKQTETIPNEIEEKFYDILNVGTWWPSLQSRLGQGIQSIKNTRTWSIPPAPGERSTLSGQFSAVHPNFLYDEKRREGGGLPASSMRLFWRIMAELYPGLFNGSEKLNAIELTKRMAWEYGGIAESLGIEINLDGETDYEQLIRFPNLSSIASARFAYNCPDKIRVFWKELEKLIRQKLSSDREKFGSRTRGRPFQVPKTDAKIDQTFNQTFNGVMFSSKWLADDMGLENKQEEETLRSLVDQAHKNSGFVDGSPADWWVIVLGDGDSMGKYVSGSKLHNYEEYLVKDAVAEEIRQIPEFAKLCQTKKRMGPATHVGLNRALLDFSNRIVPHLTEQRFCGKVVYSGGDDVMAMLPLEDLPEYLRSLRAAWCGEKDPYREQPPDDVDVTFTNQGGYWQPESKSNGDLQGLPNRPLFTMGSGATMSLGVVIAYKSVPLPTVLETLWGAEKERAKKLPGKDGLCFRVIYGGGNVLEAVMKGTLLESWWQFMQCATIDKDISPLLYRLSEELPRRAVLTENYYLFREAASVIWDKTQISEILPESAKQALLNWLTEWEDWAWNSLKQWEKQQAENSHSENPPLCTSPEDLGKLLRFSAFWVDKKLQREKWQQGEDER